MIIPNAILQIYSPQNSQETEERRRFRGLFYLLSRILNFIWGVWAITGIAWTFQSKICSNTLPVIYTMCYILAIMNLIFIGFPFIICCCSLPISISIYLCCPSFFGIKK